MPKRTAHARVQLHEQRCLLVVVLRTAPSNLLQLVAYTFSYLLLAWFDHNHVVVEPLFGFRGHLLRRRIPILQILRTERDVTVFEHSAQAEGHDRVRLGSVMDTAEEIARRQKDVVVVAGYLVAVVYEAPVSPEVRSWHEHYALLHHVQKLVLARAKRG